MKTFTYSHTNKKCKQKGFVEISPSQLKGTKLPFLGLCFYLISQSFTIPLIPIGPWAMWPTLPDIAIILLILAFLLNLNQKKPVASDSNQQIFLVLIIAFLGCIWSHVTYLDNLIDKQASGTRLGLYQIYRLVQFMFVFWITANTPLTPERIKILKLISNCVLLVVSLSVIGTLTGILPIGLLTAHLPQDLGTAGPWAYFELTGKEGGKGWGTIGYNHAYTAAQITMLAGLRIHLGMGKKVLYDFAWILTALVSSFLSGSRACFFAMLIFGVIYLLKKPAYAGAVISTSILIVMIGTLVSLPSFGSFDIESTDGSLLERQATLLDASNSENLSGRDNIWEERLLFLEREPTRWVTGIGFGAAWDFWGSGESAHQQALHIIIETGLFGLAIFCYLFYTILKSLYRNEPAEKAIYWVTIALHVAALTQETFYPVPAFGHFLGFYLFSVAISLRRNCILKA